MLKIKKSHREKEEWILYNPENFALHTHCRSLRVAVAIKRSVERLEMPKSKSIHFLRSCQRMTRNKAYNAMIERRIKEIRICRNGKRGHNGKDNSGNK